MKHIFAIIILGNDAGAEFHQLERRLDMTLLGGVVERRVSKLVFLFQNM